MEKALRIRFVQLNLIAQTMLPLYPSPRVSQLDSHILDVELFQLLKQQLADVFNHMNGKRWSFSQQPELWSLLLKLFIFKLTVAKEGASYGLKLQNLKLTNSKTGRVIGISTKLLFLGVILCEFGFQKLQSYLYSTEELIDHKGSSFLHHIKSLILMKRTKILKAVDGTLKVLKLANFISFLVYGKFPTLIHRVLSVSLTPFTVDLLKFHGDNVNFEFQNRQLVWNVMTEFLVFILPLLQINKIKKTMKRFIAKTKGEATDRGLQLRYFDLPISQCAMCIENKEVSGIKVATTHITNPFVTNCKHIYCYICLASRFNSIENDVEGAEFCPRCNDKLTSFEEYGTGGADSDPSVIIVPYNEIVYDELLDSDDTKEAAVNYHPYSTLSHSNSALEAEADDSDEDLQDEAYDEELDVDESDS